MGIFDRSSGKPDVRKLERLVNVPALLEALSYGAVQEDATWRLRASAAAALGRLGRPETLGRVREARRQAQAFAADLRSPDQAMLSQFQKAEADLLAAHSRSAGTTGPAVAAAPAAPARPAFNWVTPLFLSAFFAVALFLWPGNSYATARLETEVLNSLCAAVFIPFGLVWLVSLVFYLRKEKPPVWWRPWRPTVYVLAAVALVGGTTVRCLLTNSANDDYYSGRQSLQTKDYQEAARNFEHLLWVYPNSWHVAEVHRLLPGVGTDMVKELTGQGLYLQTLLELKDLQAAGPAEAAVVAQLRPGVLAGLAQDTGDDGKAYMQAAADRACRLETGGKADDPCLTDNYRTCSPGQPDLSDVRLSEVQLPPFPDAPARALVCPDAGLTLPPNLTASRPPELHAVIAVDTTQQADGSCDYNVGGDFSGGISGIVTLYREQQTVKVLEPQTGSVVATHDFLGDSPGCPDTYQFQSGGTGLAYGEAYGSSPAASAINAWLGSVIK